MCQFVADGTSHHVVDVVRARDNPRGGDDCRVGVGIRLMSTKYRRQSTEGYAHDGRLYGEVRVNKSKMVTETQD